MEKVLKIIKDVECPILNQRWMLENEINTSPGLKAQIQFTWHQMEDSFKDTDYLFSRCYCPYNDAPDNKGICNADKALQPCLYRRS